MQMICWRDCNWSCSWKKIELVVQICSKLSVLGLKKNIFISGAGPLGIEIAKNIMSGAFFR